MTLALLCSGQGRQDRGMFDLFADCTSAASILATASTLLGRDVRTFLGEATQAELFANRTSQILCVSRGLAAAACLKPTEPCLIAGYSVGEMTAWGIAGVWPAEQTLRLTALRAEAMDAVSGPDDSLGFVRGLNRDHVETLVKRFDCAIAIINPAQVFLIGGERKQIEQCCFHAIKEGAAASRPIAVYVASHTKRLSGAVVPFRGALVASEPLRPKLGRTLISSSGASVVSGLRDVVGLAAQVDSMIDWAATLEALVERGTDRILELGPGTALADMARAAYPQLNVRSIDDFRSLEGVATWVGHRT